MPGFIADGQTIEAYIAAALPEDSGESLHEAVNFSYRPATRQECLLLEGEMRIALRNSDIDPKCLYNSEKLVYKFVAEHVKSWDVTSAGTTPVEISAANVERLNNILMTKIYAVIRGNRLADKAPDGPAPKSDAERLGN